MTLYVIIEYRTTVTYSIIYMTNIKSNKNDNRDQVQVKKSLNFDLEDADCKYHLSDDEYTPWIIK